MTSYTEMWQDMVHHQFVSHWVPDDEVAKLGIATDGNARWWLARARAAESELKEIKGALRVLQGALKS